MSLTYTPTTELEAVNFLLSLISESPISSLSTISGLADAAVARATLHETSRDVQMQGWHFNTEEEYPLVPDASNYLLLPANTLDVDTTGADAYRNLVMRNGKLYDKENHTFTFTDVVEDVKVNLILFLTWDELPQHARAYITIKAGRIYQLKILGSEVTDTLTEDDELQALAVLKERESDNADYNMLESPDTVDIWFRDGYFI